MHLPSLKTKKQTDKEDNNSNVCGVILKSGKNKGNKCGCKSKTMLKGNYYCKRHTPID